MKKILGSFAAILVALVIMGCSADQLFLPTPQVLPMPPVNMDTPQQPITLTVINMSWEQGATIYFTDTVRTDADWDVPAGAIITNMEMKPFGDEMRPWYEYQLQDDRASRRVYASGVGTDPEPALREPELANNEYVFWEFKKYYIVLADEQGTMWLWMPRSAYYQLANYAGIIAPLPNEERDHAEYMKYKVDTKVVATTYGESLHDVLVMHPAE